MQRCGYMVCSWMVIVMYGYSCVGRGGVLRRRYATVIKDEDRNGDENDSSIFS